MSTSNPTPQQPPAERQSAEADLRTFITRFAPAHEALIGALREELRKRLPTAHEIVYEYKSWFVISYSPDDRGYEGVLGIRASTDGVKLYFNRGKDLPDPGKLLRGSGLTRSIEIDDSSTLERPAVSLLIDEAIARNPVPFATAGIGPVTIRSSTANQGRQPRAAKQDADT